MMGKYTVIWSVFFLAFAITDSTAQKIPDCCGRGVQLFPSNVNIPANGAFLIDFCEEKFQLQGKYEQLRFHAVTPKGKRYRLKVIEANFSGSMGQLLLKSRRNIRRGDSVSVRISMKGQDSLPPKIKALDWAINYKIWVSRFQSDDILPYWTAQPETLLSNYTKEIVRGYNVGINPTVMDNSRSEEFTVGDYNWLPVYLRVEFEGQRFICSADHTTPTIGRSDVCGGNFEFAYNRQYVAKIWVVDVCGNFSAETKYLPFVAKVTE